MISNYVQKSNIPMYFIILVILIHFESNWKMKFLHSATAGIRRKVKGEGKQFAKSCSEKQVKNEGKSGSVAEMKPFFASSNCYLQNVDEK